MIYGSGRKARKNWEETMTEKYEERYERRGR